MDLSDALPTNPTWPGGQGGGAWPGQPGQPTQPSWPGQPTQPSWPGQPGQPTQPSWPGQPGQPTQPSWPGQPGQPNQPTQPSWPGQPTQPTQPSQPSWPGQPTQPPQPAWPGQPSQPGQPGQPSQPTKPGWPSQPSQPTKPTQPTHPGWPSPSPQSLVVPYSQRLPNGVYDKLLITIAGIIKPNADKITVDLCTPQGQAFHFNPRFNEGGRKVIVRNSCIDTKWGREERELSNFPFVQGQPFEIKIMCSSSEYKVAVNNKHLLTFQHRVRDLRSICNLNVLYDLTLTTVNMETVN
ncbi:galectin-3b [Sebastes fasciatus]|uniref:galectin-3b n=1 Tax=Sebastes fasciatus TaxID=394691 RepID=UPI003D9F2F60